MDGWTDGASHLYGQKSKSRCTVRTQSKMPLYMTQLHRAFTGDQTVGYGSLHGVKNHFVCVREEGTGIKSTDFGTQQFKFKSWLQHQTLNFTFLIC